MTKSTPSLNPASCQMSNTHGNKYFLSSFRCNIRGRKKKQSRNQSLWTHEVIKRLSSHHFWLIIYVCCFYDLIRKSCGFESVYDNIVFFQLTRFTVKKTLFQWYSSHCLSTRLLNPFLKPQTLNPGLGRVRNAQDRRQNQIRLCSSPSQPQVFLTD